MNILVKLHLMAQANGRSVKEEMEAIVESAFQVHNMRIEHRPELAAMAPAQTALAETPSNPALAFSHVVTEEVPSPTVIPVPILRSEPVSINKPRPSPRRPHNHDSHS